MRNILFLCLMILLGCKKEKEADKFRITPGGKVNYMLDDRSLKLKFGDMINLRVGEKKIEAIVIDIRNEGQKIWYGLSFKIGDKIAGTMIRDTQNGETTCASLVEVFYLNQENIYDYELVKNEKLLFSKIGLSNAGYQNAKVEKLEEVLPKYFAAIEKRKNDDSDCEDTVKNKAPKYVYVKLSELTDERYQ